ncbi:unnamed protein product [Ceratitis capitata]|uniref:(Mediterranean fruit fly) hypothetical protein n=1 Tax=Ceratitis capitata TaxID=7213 RepID=A0A811U5G4_CERCA|nr:unnamed protein product [Ceratitis capitata]
MEVCYVILNSLPVYRSISRRTLTHAQGTYVEATEGRYIIDNRQHTHNAVDGKTDTEGNDQFSKHERPTSINIIATTTCIIVDGRCNGNKKMQQFYLNLLFYNLADMHVI